MTDDNQLIVIQQDMRALHYCSRGVREWFRLHDLDYGKFLQEGIPAETLLATGDAMAQAVVEVARGRIK